MSGVKIFWVALLGVVLSAGPAAAGWYHVENFTGTVGRYPVHVSLQYYDSFGSGITVEGSYYYDRKASPIALYGRHDKDKLALCEISDAKDFERIIVVGSKTPVDTAGCPFALATRPGGLAGTWNNAGHSDAVSLRRVATLDDTGDPGKIAGQVEIPFWTQTGRDLFMGRYTQSDAGICMTRLDVIDKASKKTDQRIDFDKDDCNAGMVATPIYLNLEQRRDGCVETITVDIRDAKMGHDEDFILDAKRHHYIRKSE